MDIFMKQLLAHFLYDLLNILTTIKHFFNVKKIYFVVNRKINFFLSCQKQATICHHPKFCGNSLLRKMSK